MPVAYSELYTKEAISFRLSSLSSTAIPLRVLLSQASNAQIEAIATLNVATADKMSAELLSILVGDPLIVCDTTYFKDDEPIANLITLYPGDFTIIEAITT